MSEFVIVEEKKSVSEIFVYILLYGKLRSLQIMVCHVSFVYVIVTSQRDSLAQGKFAIEQGKNGKYREFENAI